MTTNDPDRVHVPPDAFVRKTGQLWKLVVGGVVLPVAVSLFGLWSLLRIGPEQPEGEALGSIALLACGAVVVFAILASVRCPSCKARLLRNVFQAPEGMSALAGFLSRGTCPVCGYAPR